MAGDWTSQKVGHELREAELSEQRERVNQEKGRGVSPPRNVEEEVEAMTSSEEGVEHRRRDPQKAAEAQRDADER